MKSAALLPTLKLTQIKETDHSCPSMKLPSWKLEVTICSSSFPSLSKCEQVPRGHRRVHPVRSTNHRGQNSSCQREQLECMQNQNMDGVQRGDSDGNGVLHQTPIEKG